MHRRSCNAHDTVEAQEHGVVLILMALTLTAFIAVIGLAIDAGNLYRARIALQNAADATALATVNYVSMKGKISLEESWGVATGTDSDKVAAMNNHLNPKALILAKANLEEAGLPHLADGVHEVASVAPTTFVIRPINDPDPSVFDYQITVQRKVDYLLMHSVQIGNIGWNQSITTSATSRRRIANVALVVDISSSMSCPKTGVCDCLTPMADGTRPACPGVGSRRFDDLIDAVRDFLMMLDIDRDKIVIVPFNIYGIALDAQAEKTAHCTAAQLPSACIQSIADALKQDYPPATLTNIFDGLLQGWASLRDQTTHVSPRASYLLFSDGAPTASRFLFSDAAAIAAKLGVRQSGHNGTVDSQLGNYDYTSYTISWRDDANNIVAGPSVLVPTDSITGFSSSDPRQIDRGPSQSCLDGLSCAGNPNLSCAPVVNAAGDVPTAGQQVFGECVNTLEAHMPGMPTNVYGSDYLSGIASNPGFKDWRQQYYNGAIEMADFIRTKKGVVYVVALGDKVAAPDPNDPYENIDEYFHRKDIFLNRLALDLKGAEVSGPQFSYHGYDRYEDLSAMSPQQGVYLPTHNPADVKLLFTRIARKILLRLVS
jgi:hypothetical protein